MSDHCCVHLRCITSREAAGLREHLSVLSRIVHDGYLNTEVGATPLNRIGYALDRIGALQPEVRGAYISQHGLRVEARIKASIAYDSLWNNLEDLDGRLQEVAIPICERNELCAECRVKA